MVPAAAVPAAFIGLSDAASLFNRLWAVAVLTPLIASMAAVGAGLAWKARPLPALQTTTAYGTLVGVMPAIAALFQGVGSPLGVAVFLLPLVPAVLAAYSLAAAWLRISPWASSVEREARTRTATRLAAILVGFGGIEAFALVGFLLALAAPCNAASASQTACSNTSEELLGGLCSFVVVFPVLAPILLGLHLKKEEEAFLRAIRPGVPPR